MEKTKIQYRADRVIAAIGMKAALPFLKVSNEALHAFLTRKVALGEITEGQMAYALYGPVDKVRESGNEKITNQ